ncbi:hypothetical protein BJ875DRAFT_487491 [Amylocarpus encephaloides]|uniref:Methyltransferase domain-containing protein n=1 Tax=Amylocarpus encephaloides TaxID=45428 RepID=A0A9P7YBM9_9HELO|nr:hypothetical protein BJ875DRAFT_487491 [Amylocarpus encephaloides]
MATTTTAGDDGYFMASPEEMSRLENQHYIIKDAMGGLLLPPIDISVGPLRILDSATADGTWIRDLAAGAPSHHQFVGTDIDPRKFPESPPSNTKYQIADINKPWPEEWKRGFDIVHQRLAIASGGAGAKQAIENLAELVKPGGWIQLVEAGHTFDDAEEGTAMRHFIQLILDLYAFMGVPEKVGDQLKPWLEGSGFVNVQERTIDCYMGAMNPDPDLARNGVFSMNVAVTGLVGFGQTLPPEVLFKGEDSKKILGTLVEDLRAEMRATGANYPLKVVWGQFPA